jgi:hypothetical protein
MQHYENDIFTWVLIRDENVHRGRFPVTWRAFYKLRFERGEGETFDTLLWENGGALSAVEAFVRLDKTAEGKL